MDRFWWWCKHLYIVYLFIHIFLLDSFATSSSPKSNLEEPTEEPEELIDHDHDLASQQHHRVSKFKDDSNYSSTGNPFIRNNTQSRHAYNISGDGYVSPKINKTYLNDRHKQNPSSRAFPHSSGNLWSTASILLRKGLRKFRESLLEGAKVAHMFKEDIDEGVQSIMRQNRGIRQNGQSDHSKNQAPPGFFDSQMLREGVLGGILRFMGINSKQIGVIALNMLIIFAEWITSSMIGNNEVAGATSRMIKTNLLQWASTGHNPQIEKILVQAKSHTLPEKLITNLSIKTGNQTSCVQLLICKMSPIIWGFQDTMQDQMKAFGINEKTAWRTAPKESEFTFENETMANEGQWKEEPRGFLATSQYLFDKFLGHLPPTERMVDFGDRCEMKFPHCQLLKFGHKQN